jgi:hypothetical protein
MAALCILCATVPWLLGGLPLLYKGSPLPYWMCLVTCLTCLHTLNMVTNPLYHAFKCMLAWSKMVPRFQYPLCRRLLHGHQCYTTETIRHQQAY